MTDEAVELDERARVEEPLDPLAREQLAGRPVPLDGPLVARVQRLLAEVAQPPELRLRRVRSVCGRSPVVATPGG